MIELRHPTCVATRTLVSEHAVTRNLTGICRDVLAVIISCRGTGPKALLEQPVTATLGPHPALTAALGPLRRDRTWKMTPEAFTQALASLDIHILSVGAPSSFARCKLERRKERLTTFLRAVGTDLPQRTTCVDSAETENWTRTGPGWLTLDFDTTHVVITPHIGSVTVGPLSAKRPRCGALELDDLDILLEAAGRADILCFEEGKGGKLSELRAWQGEIAAVRRSSLPNTVIFHLDASTTRTSGTGNDNSNDHDDLTEKLFEPHGGWHGHVATAEVVDAVEQLAQHGIGTIADDDVVDCVAMSEARPVGRSGLFAHQDLAVARYKATRRGMILAFDPGAGKTPTACVALSENLTEGGCAVVIAPRNVCPQWEQELTLWTSLPFTCWKPGRPLPRNGVILCASNDAAAFADLAEQVNITFTDLVIDEARFLKTRTQQTIACQRLRNLSDRCLLLSATPARRQVGDYARLLTFARGERWDPAAFNAAGGHDLNFLNPLVAHGTLPEARQIHFHTHRTSLVDDSTHIDELAELLNELRTLEARHGQYSTLADGGERRRNRGQILLHIERVTTHLSSMWSAANTNYIATEAASSPRPALIFIKSPKTRSAVAEMLHTQNISVGTLDQAKNAEASARDFQTGKFDVLIVGAAGEEGLNLTRAQRVLIGDTPFEPTVLRQRVGRAARIGHDGTVLDVHFFAPSAAAARTVRSLIKAAGQPVADGGALGVAAACCGL